MDWVLALANIILDFFTWAVILRALFTWVTPERENPTVRTIEHGLYRVTEPLLGPIRKAIGAHGPVDISPVIVLVLIYVVRRVLLALLR